MNDVLVSRLSRRAPMIERLALWPDMIIGLSVVVLKIFSLPSPTEGVKITLTL